MWVMAPAWGFGFPGWAGLSSSGILEAMRVLRLNTRARISLTKLFLDLVTASDWSGTSSVFCSYNSEIVTSTMVQTWSKVLFRLSRTVFVSGIVPSLSEVPILSRSSLTPSCLDSISAFNPVRSWAALRPCWTGGLSASSRFPKICSTGSSQSR